MGGAVYTLAAGSISTTAILASFTIDEVIEDEEDVVQGITGYQLKAARRSLYFISRMGKQRTSLLGSRKYQYRFRKVKLNIFFIEIHQRSSATTVAPTVYGLSDIMEASFRQNYGGTNQIAQ